jgi:hypothetical protein
VILDHLALVGKVTFYSRSRLSFDNPSFSGIIYILSFHSLVMFEVEALSWVLLRISGSSLDFIFDKNGTQGN